MTGSPAIEVLAVGSWSVHWGGIQGSCNGLDGQLTKCRRAGVVFYVRENLSSVDHFVMSSAARISMKQGRIPKGSHQVLELAAPAGCWEEIATEIRERDGLGRPVFRHQRFTADWAEEQLLKAARCPLFMEELIA